MDRLEVTLKEIVVAPATSTRCSPKQAFSLISSFIDDGFSFSLSSDTASIAFAY
jgi:hypothetical protein